MKDSPIKSIEQSKEDEEEKAKRSRRSKADTEGRNFECSICGKSYLSYAALYTHKKNKHKEENGDEPEGEVKKRRQKAKTEESENAQTTEQTVSAETLEYFTTQERVGSTNSVMIPDVFRDVFNDIFIDNWETQFKESLSYAKYNEWDKYPLYTIYIKQEAPAEEPKSDVNFDLKCDEVLAQYLGIVSQRTNLNFFRRVVKFVYLFREFLNKFHSKEDIETEYTSTNSAENSPDSTNEFIIDFMGLDEPKFGYNKDESIQLTQNLCRWMFDQKYTYSKLTIK
jgi:hypothetical protein